MSFDSVGFCAFVFDMFVLTIK